MRNALFYGSGVALVTPFSGDKVDFRAFEALIHWQIDMLTDAIVILGTTGEPCTIAPSERAALIECAVSTVAGRVPLIVGAGANDTRAAVAHAAAGAGAGRGRAAGGDALLQQGQPRGASRALRRHRRQRGYTHHRLQRALAHGDEPAARKRWRSCSSTR